MNFVELAKRNFREAIRNPLSLALTLLLPPALLLVLESFGGADSATFNATFLTPGIALFGFVMLMFSAAMTLSRDRESAMFTRLLTTPLKPSDFVAGYSVPYFPVAIAQVVVIFAIGALFGFDAAGSVVLAFLVLLIMAVLFIALGMIIGAVFTYKQVPFAYMVILLLTIFGGAWVDIESIGGGFKRVGDLFPFAHSLDAVRDVLVDGAGLGDIVTDLVWVVAYTLVIVGLAVFAFRRRMYE